MSVKGTYNFYILTFKLCIKLGNRKQLQNVDGIVQHCNLIFGENYFFLIYKLVARKLDFVLSKLQISIWKDEATVAW